MRNTQTQINSITAVQGTTRAVTAFELTPGEWQADIFFDYWEPSSKRKPLQILSISLIAMRVILRHSHLKSMKLIPEYGQLTLNNIRNSVANCHLQPSKATQNSETFAKLFINSLALHTKEGICVCMVHHKQVHY